jgi:hypothetical protein
MSKREMSNKQKFIGNRNIEEAVDVKEIELTNGNPKRETLMYTVILASMR